MKPCLSHWDEVARHLARRPNLFLALDYDGVLTPLARRAAQANLTRSTERLLQQLLGLPNVRLAVISGRALNDLRKKVPLPHIILAGNHGLDIQFPGKRERHGAGWRYRRALDEAKRRLGDILRQFPGTFIEEKRLGVGLHYQALKPAARARLIKKFNVWRKKMPATLAVVHQKFMFDLVPNVSWDKGKAVRRIWRHLGLEWVPVYVGDDRADEAAFRALRGHGITILVGSPRSSYARYYVRSPHEVGRLLIRIRDLLCGGASH